MNENWQKVGGSYTIPLIAQEHVDKLRMVLAAMAAEETRLNTQIQRLRFTLGKVQSRGI